MRSCACETTTVMLVGRDHLAPARGSSVPSANPAFVLTRRRGFLSQPDCDVQFQSQSKGSSAVGKSNGLEASKDAPGCKITRSTNVAMLKRFLARVDDYIGQQSSFKNCSIVYKRITVSP